MIQEPDLNNKYMLSLKEAADYYGLGVKKMRRIAENGKGYFSIFNGNRWIIVRHKFEEYIEQYYLSGQIPEEEIPIKLF